jgi:ADP-heptose:LPS heptosyltransferase
MTHPTRPSRHVLVVRLDSLGDMLVCGPAIRAVAAGADRLTVLSGPGGAAAAALLPGVDEVLVWDCPWIAGEPAAVDPVTISGVVRRIEALDVSEAVVLTSFHQSALPTALVLRLAGVARIAAVSEDYPGSLLDVRLSPPDEAPEPVRMRAIAEGAGFPPPPGDDGRLAVRLPLPDVAALPRTPYLVVHPGVTAPARAYPQYRWVELVRALTRRGWPVLVTGTVAESDLTSALASAAEPPRSALDCAGAHDLPALAAVLQGAAAVVVANTGPAHLAAAVGTAVVSLYAPVVPAQRWAPYGVPVALLGDQHAVCRDTRARVCPVPGHPCLAGVGAAEVVAAVERLAGASLVGASPGEASPFAAARKESA